MIARELPRLEETIPDPVSAEPYLLLIHGILLGTTPFGGRPLAPMPIEQRTRWLRRHTPSVLALYRDLEAA